MCLDSLVLNLQLIYDGYFLSWARLDDLVEVRAILLRVIIVNFCFFSKTLIDFVCITRLEKKT